ncbi:MAG: hypothetical protein WA949_21660 [Phormidesmis sp.]
MLIAPLSNATLPLIFQSIAMNAISGLPSARPSIDSAIARETLVAF